MIDASLATADPDTPASCQPDRARSDEMVVPRELVREVAGNLRSLARVLPYEEYAAIVHRIASLRWRCTTSAHATEATSRTPDWDEARSR